jgi:hypothetical protein
VTKAKDPVEVVATIRRSIEVSTRGSRRLRFHQLRDLSGFQAWSGQRKELVARLHREQGIAVQPPVGDIGAGDWVVLSLPQLLQPRDDHPGPRPTPELFDHLEYRVYVEGAWNCDKRT